MRRTYAIIGGMIAAALAGMFFFFYSQKGEFSDLPQLIPLGLIEENNANKKEDNAHNRLSFHDPDIGIIFRYPEGFHVSVWPEGDGGKMILLERDGDEQQEFSQRQGVQIFIAPFDEEGMLTAERILQDLPDLSINNLRYGMIGGRDALFFTARDPGGIETQEAWVVARGNLYQISAYGQMRGKFASILETIIFSP